VSRRPGERGSPAQGGAPRPDAFPLATARRRLAPPTAVRARIQAGYRDQIANLGAQERHITRQLTELVTRSGSTLGELCGLPTVSVAELPVVFTTRAGSRSVASCTTQKRLTCRA
jgi:hypothetical protein